MGVKGFNTWFRKQYPAAYLGVKRHYDHLYIDMASFLHEELRKGELSILGLGRGIWLAAWTATFA